MPGQLMAQAWLCTFGRFRVSESVLAGWVSTCCAEARLLVSGRLLTTGGTVHILAGRCDSAANDVRIGVEQVGVPFGHSD